jgi:hypothetical protein
LRWEDATAAQIAKATAAVSNRKSVNLVIALRQVPPVDPEQKVLVIQKIATACKVNEKLARAALDQFVIDGQVDEVTIPNPNRKKRGFKGVVKHQ